MYRYARLTASGRLADTPLLLHSITFVTDTTAKGVSCYDAGNLNTDNKIITISGIENETTHVGFRVPVRCNYGLYLVIDAEVDEVLVVYTLLNE